MKKVVLALVAVVVLALAAAGGGLAWLEGGGAKRLIEGDAAAIEFTVPKGASSGSLGALLVEQKLIEDARLWKWHVKRHPISPKAGRHALKPSMTIAEIAKALEGAPLADDVPFVMIEGWRLRDTDAALAAKGWIKPGAYIAAASQPSKFKAPFPLPATTLEGYLYPETYKVVPTPFDVDALIQRQLDTFAERFYAPHKDALGGCGRSLADVVTMASMLEREEPTPEKRPTVAGILWKRIDRGFPLGVDATSRYELAEWNDRTAFLKKLKDPDDKYNTRVKVGLPPGPIGAPTAASLQAAMKPEKNEYLYYLHDANKVLHPSRNAEEHEALRAKYNVY